MESRNAEGAARRTDAISRQAQAELMAIGFNPKKAAQVVAFLIRLVYLSDREFMARYDRPILFDDFFCLDLGPVDSMTYNAIKAKGKLDRPWSDYIQARDGDDIFINPNLTDNDFDELSVAEERAMDEVLHQHRHRRSFDLVDWIHRHCREWSNPRGTSVALPYFEVWKALGKTDSEKMDEHINEIRNLSQSLIL
jgi:uncharacterized phage-associated protein